jgi:3-oxoacyl-[acyl-carrier protein] reductase
VAVVTGAAQGVGLGIARVLARAGYRMVMADVDSGLAGREAVALERAGHDAQPAALDVTCAAQWSALVEQVGGRLGRLDLLVNNAGISPRGTPESVDEDLWDRTLAVNLKGPWLGIRACLPLLRAARGTIVNIGSTRATRPRRGLFAYGVSKAGLLGLTKQVAVDCLDDGVTCNMVAPGWVDTPGERLLQARHGRPDFPKGTRNLIDPEEVGEAVRFLATPAGRRINGVILYVDAGLHCADDVAMIYNAADDSETHAAAGPGDEG